MSGRDYPILTIEEHSQIVSSNYASIPIQNQLEKRQILVDWIIGWIGLLVASR
jgi:hypothetical protein